MVLYHSLPAAHLAEVALPSNTEKLIRTLTNLAKEKPLTAAI